MGCVSKPRRRNDPGAVGRLLRTGRVAGLACARVRVESVYTLRDGNVLVCVAIFSWFEAPTHRMSYGSRLAPSSLKKSWTLAERG